MYVMFSVTISSETKPSLNPGGYKDITKYLKFTKGQPVLVVKKFNQFKSRLRFHAYTTQFINPQGLKKISTCLLCQLMTNAYSTSHILPRNKSELELQLSSADLQDSFAACPCPWPCLGVVIWSI